MIAAQPRAPTVYAARSDAVKVVPSTRRAGGTASPHRALVNQSALPLAERQNQTLQPHHGHRMGLPAGLPHQRRPHLGVHDLAAALQH
jgi:hypothetical protein